MQKLVWICLIAGGNYAGSLVLSWCASGPTARAQIANAVSQHDYSIADKIIETNHLSPCVALLLNQMSWVREARHVDADLRYQHLRGDVTDPRHGRQ